MKKILFIGLGRMGFPMAGHMSKNAGFSVSVHNRSAEKVTRWLSTYNGSSHDDNQRYDAIVLCVGNDNDVLENLSITGQFIPCLKEGGIIIDHTTTSAMLAQQLSEECHQHGFHYLDAPVSGGEAGAINGQLSCMVGGDVCAFEQITEILDSYCHNVVRIGESGAGQVSKMANQLCIAGTLAGLSEAITLIDKAGIDASNVYQAIKGGAAQSWQLDNRFETMVAGSFDFGFAIEHMIKDLNYALAEVKKQEWQAPIGTTVLSDYCQLLQEGHSGHDTSVLIEAYKKGESKADKTSNN